MVVVQSLLFLVVIGTAIWVGVDAHTVGVAKLKGRKDLPGSVRTSAFAWAVGVFLIWIIFFPYYLAKRPAIKAAVASLSVGSAQPVSTSTSWAPAAPPAGWYPDPSGSGGQRWWDGIQWGPTAPQPPRTAGFPGNQ